MISKTINSKKAVVEVQFNWIFALIVGGMILFFFVTVISYQKELSDKQLGVELGSQLEMIFAGRGVATGTKQPIDIAEIPISFSCNDYSILNQRISLGNLVVFSPQAIETKKLLSITLGFDLPFRTNNLIMLTSPQVKYYFVGFSETGIVKEQIQNVVDFPNAPEGEKVDYAFVDFGNGPDQFDNLKYENNPYVKFVFNKDQLESMRQENPPLPAAFAGVSDKNVKAITAKVYINDETGEVEEKIPIKFYKKDGSSFVLEDESSAVNSFTFNTFIAAVFADSFNSYDCAMRKAMQRAKNTVQVYRGKYELIKSAIDCTPGSSDPCCGPVASALESLTSLESSLAPSDVGGSDISSAITELKNLNEQAILASCPTVY